MYRPVGRVGSTYTPLTSTPAAAISASSARPNGSSPTALTQALDSPSPGRCDARFDSAPPIVRFQVRTRSGDPLSAGTNNAIDSPMHSTALATNHLPAV